MVPAVAKPKPKPTVGAMKWWSQISASHHEAVLVSPSVSGRLVGFGHSLRPLGKDISSRLSNRVLRIEMGSVCRWCHRRAHSPFVPRIITVNFGASAVVSHPRRWSRCCRRSLLEKCRLCRHRKLAVTGFNGTRQPLHSAALFGVVW